jgi:hypothetical protein
MEKYRLLTLIILLFPLFSIISTPVYADKKYRDRGDRKYQRYDKQYKSKNYRFDKRYRHDRYYPSHGIRLKNLPRRNHQIKFKNRPYFYSSGIWYLRSGAQFVVTIPPFGIVVPFLPPFYTTIWVRDVPYYYANDVYYIWEQDRNGYVVTSPPEDINEQETHPLVEKLFIYPSRGQNEKKQADDRYECHRWGVSQTEYDPSQPPENMTLQELGSKHENYQKAMKACLVGRGYSVR